MKLFSDEEFSWIEENEEWIAKASLFEICYKIEHMRHGEEWKAFNMQEGFPARLALAICILESRYNEVYLRVGSNGTDLLELYSSLDTSGRLVKAMVGREEIQGGRKGGGNIG